MYFHIVGGTGSYTTSTTNMHNKYRFHVRRVTQRVGTGERYLEKIFWNTIWKKVDIIQSVNRTNGKMMSNRTNGKMMSTSMTHLQHIFWNIEKQRKRIRRVQSACALYIVVVKRSTSYRQCMDSVGERNVVVVLLHQNLLRVWVQGTDGVQQILRQDATHHGLVLQCGECPMWQI